MMSKACRRGGFTLVELLVALVITGVVVAVAQALVGLGADMLQDAREERELNTTAARQRAAIVSWISAAELMPGATFEGREVAGGDFPQSELQFAVVDAGALYPGPHRIRLFIDYDPATPQKGFVAEISGMSAANDNPVDTLAVAPAALGMQVRFQITSARGAPAWVTTWDSERELPIAVELRLLAPAGSGRALPPLLAFPLYIPITRGVL